jgi:hypothetical protein
MDNQTTPPSSASSPGPSPSGAVPQPSATAADSGEGSLWEIYLPKRGEIHRKTIYIASFPQIVYFWPTILTLFLCALVQAATGTISTGAGWATVIVTTLNLMILVQDFDQKKFIIFVLAVVVSLLGTWIINLYGFTFIQRITGWILGFSPQINTDAYLLMGTLMLVLFIWGMIAPLFSYWRLEPNEFIHYTQPIGKDMSIARAGCTVYKEITDVFESLLGFGSGNLVIRRDNQLLATIQHVPLLAFRMKAIEHMLSETRVVVEKSI